MECLNQQSRQADAIVIVDSGSTNPSYLTNYQPQENVTVVLAEGDVGFCKGNNIGLSRMPLKSDYVLFLNPDAFLTPRFIQEALSLMEDPKHAKWGAVSGTVLGYDMQANTPTGKYDSTGIFRTWYGHWYDRGQGRGIDEAVFSVQQCVPAICAAVIFCRKKALDSILMRENEVFDNTFYMYKDDIDLSLRLRKKGWMLMFVPSLMAYHCRGWQRDRSLMPRELRLCSAWNEVRIQKGQHAMIPLLYSLCKYAAVKYLDK